MFDVTCLDKYGNTVTNLTQWDLNQTLYIEDHGFTTPPQFHFCNKNSEKAFVVQSTVEDDVLQVEVPNILLIEPYTITAYVYLIEDDSSKTVEYVQIPVRQRPQPDSFEYENNTVVVDLYELAAEIKALNANISSAEEERINAESIRIENENTRIENEEDRKSSEILRKSEEEVRIQSESIRVQNEELRELAEEERIANEELRKTAENERIDAETVRAEAEASRIEEETIRKESESDRVIAEGERISNENLRIDAETEREDAEVIRRSQEEARQTNTTIAIQNANEATDRANLAAEACEGIVDKTGVVLSTEKGLAGGVATLNEEGKVPLEQLPDDIGGDTVPEGVTYIDFENPTGEEVGDIIPLDADTLQGHGAEYFAFSADIDSNTDINSVTKSGMYRLNGGHTNVPDDCNYGQLLVVHGARDTIAQIAIPYNGGAMYFRAGNPSEVGGNGSWSNWETLVTTEDLANYLPLSGDIPLPRNVNVGSATTNHVVWMGFLNTVRNLSWQLLTDGTFRLSDNTNGNAPIVFGANGTNTFNGTATNANNLFGKYGSEVGILHNPNYGGVEYAYNVSMDEPGLFPNVNNANSVLTLNRHAGEYTSQMGFSSNGRLYYRIFDAEAMNSTKPWREILDTGNYSDYALSKNGTAASATTLSGLTATVTELNYVDGVTSNIQTQLNGKALSEHNHTVVNGVTPDWSGSIAYADTDWLAAWTSDGKKIKALNKNSFASSSHGNHVPTTQTANNAIFLRNDNTWQTITPANIGAAPASHNQSASTITSGTFTSTGVYAAAGTDYTTARIRNIVTVATDPGEGASVSYPNGTIIFSK